MCPRNGSQGYFTQIRHRGAARGLQGHCRFLGGVSGPSSDTWFWKLRAFWQIVNKQCCLSFSGSFVNNYEPRWDGWKVNHVRLNSIDSSSRTWCEQLDKCTAITKKPCQYICFPWNALQVVHSCAETMIKALLKVLTVHSMKNPWQMLRSQSNIYHAGCVVCKEYKQGLCSSASFFFSCTEIQFLRWFLDLHSKIMVK